MNQKIFLKNKMILDLIQRNNNKIRLEKLIAILCDHMIERTAKEYIKTLHLRERIIYKIIDKEVYISVTEKGKKYANQN